MEIGEGDDVNAAKGFSLMEFRRRAIAPVGVVEIDTFERWNGGDTLQRFEAVFDEMDVFLVGFDEFRKCLFLRRFAVQTDDVFRMKIDIEMCKPCFDKPFLLSRENQDAMFQ